jgi:hypothetical protein
MGGSVGRGRETKGKTAPLRRVNYFELLNVLFCARPGSHVGREVKPIGISSSGRGVSKRLGYMYEVGSGNDCI